MKPESIVRISLVLAFFLVLEIVSRSGVLKPGLILPPSAMLAELWLLLKTPSFWSSVGSSSRAVGVAFVLSMVVGCSIAVVLHNLPRLRNALEPLIASYYALPVFVLYPLLVVLMGMNQAPIITLGFLYAVVAVIVGTLNGLDRIPVVLRRTGRAFRLSDTQQALFISLPAAAPYVFTGAKLAFGYAITGVLGSEFILASSGFGYDVSYAYNNFEDRKMYALLLFLLVVVSALTMLLHFAERLVEHRSGPSRHSIERTPATRLEKLLAVVGVAFVIVLVWELVHLRVGSEALASPAATLAHLLDLFMLPRFWQDVRETMIALGLAVFVSCALGGLVGLLLGQSRFAGEVATPMLVTLYALPKVALYPIVLLIVGIGLGAKVLFGAMYGMIPMILVTMNAVQSMNPVFRRTARVMRVSRAETISTIILPAVVPEIVTGIRITFSLALLGVMIGEMFASNKGLGFLIMTSINVNDTSTMMAVTILIGLFAIILNSVLLAFENRINPA